MRRAWLIVVVGGALLPAGLLAGPAKASGVQRVPGIAPRVTAPTVTLTSPVSGGLVTKGQPTFSGAAGSAPEDIPTVVVNLYAGSSVSGVPAQQLSATVTGGAYSVGPAASLTDGVYTAQATQDDSSSPPDVGMSAAVTFRVDNAPPAIELDPPASEPQLTSTPTLSGFAGTFVGDVDSVTVDVYPGGSTDAVPAGSLSSPVAVNGSFSAQLPAGLADGVYTVIASQSTALGPVFSAPVTIEIKVIPPTLTVTDPTAGQSVSQAAVSFSGAAGDDYGDSSEVVLSLFRGASATGQRIGAIDVPIIGTAWHAQWPRTLSLGIDTLQAQQHDIAGRITTVEETFIVVPPPAVIGNTVRISQTGLATVPIDCVTASGSCAGDLLILTHNAFRTTPGGPLGHLRVLFVKFAAIAGQTFIVRRPLVPAVLRVLRRAHTQKVTVTVVIGPGTAAQQVYIASRSVKVGS